MKPTRITLSRKAGWRMPENTVKVTRPGKWGNPFKIGDPHPHPDENCRPIRDAAEAVELFTIHAGVLGLHENICTEAHTLRGKNLACWCKQGQPCHADVLLELANA